MLYTFLDEDTTVFCTKWFTRSGKEKRELNVEHLTVRDLFKYTPGVVERVADYDDERTIRRYDRYTKGMSSEATISSLVGYWPKRFTMQDINAQKNASLVRIPLETVHSLLIM